MVSKAGKTGLDTAVGTLSYLTKCVRGETYPSIGPGLTGLSGQDLASAVVRHRMLKFHPEKSVEPKLRKERSIQRMLSFDQAGLSQFDYRALPHRERRNFLLAKEQLSKFGRSVRRSNRFRAPGGETCHSAEGDVDLLVKLSDDDQWRVSRSAATEVAGILYHNQALRRVVKEKFRKLHPHWRFYADTWFSETHSRFTVFVRMFLACCHITSVSRLSSVPKNSEEDRTISMEPLFNMIGQLSFAGDLKDALQEVYGYILDQRAQLHRTLLRHERKVTVDLKNASNSNWWCVIQQLWPERLVRRLKSLRTPVCEYNGQFHAYNMLAPMGCGFTFEVMTITLLHLARVLDPGASVFGDDIIIEASVYEEFHSLLLCTGWVINDEKTFVTGCFRESCGAFHDLSSDTAIVSYEFHPILTQLDVCTTANKLRDIVRAGQISTRLKEHMLRAWIQLAKAVPRVAWRAESDFVGDALPVGVCIVPDTWFNATKSPPTQMSLCYNAMYHREVTIGKRYRIILPESSYTGYTERIKVACYLRRGESYTPDLRVLNPTPIFETVLCGGEGLLHSNPLLSFI